jgi:hypothetical protein
LNLADLVIRETEVPAEEIMFLRHGNDSIGRLRHFGVTIEEFTSLQPAGEKYDYFHPGKPRISVVVVIVEDRVYGVYRVHGVEKEGPTYSVASEAYKRFDAERSKSEVLCRLFKLVPIVSVCTGLLVRGWEGGRTRTPVQRYGDKFFSQVEVGPTSEQDQLEAVEQSFRAQVSDSLHDTPDARLTRLAQAERFSHRVAVTSFVFARNPDVVAEVLYRARGICQACGNQAPFNRRSDQSPYLEVHHKTPLASGGEDTVENAIALCPNCHRKAHYA